MIDRVLIEAATLGNPFVQAWAEAFALTGANVIVVSDLVAGQQEGLTESLLAKTVFSSEQSIEWVEQVESRLGGAPTAIFLWWGFQSIYRSRTFSKWPKAKVILCVDTFPNASGLPGELAERLRKSRSIRQVDTLVVTSEMMRQDMLRNRLGFMKTFRNVEVLETPFSIRSHTSVLTAPSNKTFKMIFTGRSDYLFSTDKKMAKDSLGVTLEQFMSENVQVSVQRPASFELQDLLAQKGFHFYPQMDRKSVLDGQFADMISHFDAHFVGYNISNATIGRRVSMGLSTRYAVGLCSSAPMIIQKEATFAAQKVIEAGIGEVLDDTLGDVISRLAEKKDNYRTSWNEHHQQWAAESHVVELKRILAF